MTIEPLWTARRAVRSEKPLIHCITNPISINDCANAILAVGAQPIMAEHPQEVAAITRSADALLVNLGNITDVRLESMRVSGEQAKEEGVPSVIDLVGVGCSLLRLQFARKYVGLYHPTVIKGNLSELKTFAGTPTRAAGVDAAEDDRLTERNTDSVVDQLRRLAKRTGAVILATGETDVVTDGERICLLKNGTPMLARITGTGCVAGALTAAYLSKADGLTAAVLAAATLGVSGELAARGAKGTGSFRVALIDHLSTLEDHTLEQMLRWEWR